MIGSFFFIGSAPFDPPWFQGHHSPPVLPFVGFGVTVEAVNVEVETFRVGFPNSPHFFDDLVFGHVYHPPFTSPVSSGLPGKRPMA